MIFKLSQMGNGVDVREKHHYMNVKKSKELNLNFALLLSIKVISVLLAYNLFFKILQPLQ